MPNVMIKQFGDHIACTGLHFGGPPERRKLLPGEVVTIPDDLTVARGGKQMPLLDILLESGQLEITRKPATRPLDYPNARLARLCSPAYKPTGVEEQREVDEAHALVEQFMQSQPSAPEDEPESPADSQAAEAPPRKPVTRRGRRLANLASAHEQGDSA